MRAVQLGLLAFSLYALSVIGCQYLRCELDADSPELYCCGGGLVLVCLILIHRRVKELPSLGACFVLAVLANFLVAFTVPSGLRAIPQGRLTGCKSNLRNIAAALESYASDNAGHYPSSLSQLSPKYLELLPKCPGARQDTYSELYRKSEKPDAYTVSCSGTHHRLAGSTAANYPQYSSYSGLILP